MGRNGGERVRALHVRGDDNGLAGAEIDSFLRCWARGGAATAPTGRSGSIGGKAVGGYPINSYAKVSVIEEVIDLAGASSVTSVNNLLPANSLILEIVTHPVVEFSTPTTYNLGDTTTGTRFGTALANDVPSEGPVYASAHWAGTVAIRQVAAAPIKVTPNAAGTGKLHVAVFYISFLGGQA